MAVPSLFAVFIFAILQQSSNALFKSSVCQPLSVNNGNVRYAGSNGIQKFSFNCQNGFAPMGKTFSTCLNGQWSNPNPFCVDQSSVKVIENGYMTMSADNKYMIACNEGYTLLGSSELKLDGSSSSKCISNNGLVTIVNGAYQVTNNGQIVCYYSCDEGYQLLGNNKLVYQNNQWVGVPPTCIKTIVNEIKINFSNGNYSVSEDKRTYEFQCNPGFQLLGESRIQYINNAWTASVPICLEIAVRPSQQIIPPVASPQQPSVIITHNVPLTPENTKPVINFANGIYSVSEDGRTYEFQCNSGFEMYGKSRIQYINNAWTDSVPVCLASPQQPSVIITHNVPLTPENTKPVINFANGIYSVSEDGRAYEFQCNSGFQLLGQPRIQFIYNAWTASIPLCIALNAVSQQTSPTSPTITKARKSIPHGNGITNPDGSVTFSCDGGYSMYGYPIVQPQSNQFPVCVPTNDLVIDNGRVEVAIVSTGYELLYTCNEGFQLSSDENGTLTTEQQVNTKKACVPTCPILYFKNGWVESNDQSRTAHFGCCDGFQIEGPTESTCFNGMWTSPTPQCIPLCKTINLMNGQATYHRDSTTFSCNPGYYLLGANKTVCNNGKWMDDTPICVPNCPMPEIVNGDIIPDVSKNNFKIVCHDGFELFGSDEMSCVYGQWSQPAPFCAADCQPLHINNGVAQNVNNSKVVRVQCNYGYVLNGTQEISCNGGNWSAPPPTCISLCDAVRIYRLVVDTRDLVKFNCSN